jgi:hypothetical protein
MAAVLGSNRPMALPPHSGGCIDTAYQLVALVSFAACVTTAFGIW